MGLSVTQLICQAKNRQIAVVTEETVGMLLATPWTDPEFVLNIDTKSTQLHLIEHTSPLPYSPSHQSDFRPHYDEMD